MPNFTATTGHSVLTGAGGEFIPYIDFSSFGSVADPGVWSQVHDEGVPIVENIASIRVPMVAVVEGRAHVSSEYALLAGVIVGSESRSSRMTGMSDKLICQSLVGSRERFTNS